ncbi:HNH endonuclease signature motif containing protein [Peribacillus frigoritolerans]|uniref:HNH endonuclease signature motif containing protein n=1 Tax=Peribacillus frigoritolerans TaxID=450367 RepID=UPI0035CE8C0D
MKKQTCRVCLVEKEIKEFSTTKRNAIGVTSECKACRCATRTLNQSYLKERLRKYKIRSNEGRVSITLAQLESLLVQPDCTYCGCELTSENKVVDHIYALNGYGGANLLINLTIACRSCNSSKSNHHIYDFYSRSEKFTEELWTSFVRNYSERFLKRKLTDEQVEKMKINFADEARELAANA